MSIYPKNRTCDLRFARIARKWQSSSHASADSALFSGRNLLGRGLFFVVVRPNGVILGLLTILCVKTGDFGLTNVVLEMLFPVWDFLFVVRDMLFVAWDVLSIARDMFFSVWDDISAPGISFSAPGMSQMVIGGTIAADGICLAAFG